MITIMYCHVFLVHSVLCTLMCTANRYMSAAVNSSIEFDCSTDCTSNISWSYVFLPASSAPQHNNFSLLTPACLYDGRCLVNNSTATGHSQLIIDLVQFKDYGTYLCSSGAKHQPDYCEMSFNFTGSSPCRPISLCIMYIRT